MDLYYYEEVSDYVSMIKNTGEILRSLTEHFMCSAAPSAVDRSFKVRDEKEAKYLP